MQPNNQVSRREFIASTSVLLAASQLGVAEVTENEADKLAINGGKKALTCAMPKPQRWGEPELQQLGAAVKQDSLYYWNNAQTKLLDGALPGHLRAQVRAALLLGQRGVAHRRGRGGHRAR